MRLLVAALLLVAPTPALACLPPIPGEPEPKPLSLEERARSIGNWATDIVFGTVTRDSGERPARLRIRHVYKGALRVGQVIPLDAAWGFNAPPCSGMIPPPPLTRGDVGVLAWSGEPEANWLDDKLFAQLVASGTIRSARQTK